MAEVQADYSAAERVLAFRRPQAVLTVDDVRQMVGDVEDKVRMLAEADPVAKSALYSALGIRLTYDHQRNGWRSKVSPPHGPLIVSEEEVGQTPTGDCLPGPSPKSGSYLERIDGRLDESIALVEVFRPVVFGEHEEYPDADTVRNFDASSMKPRQSYVSRIFKNHEIMLEERLQLPSREWFGEIVALYQVASHLPQSLQLTQLLDSLGNGAHAKVPRQLENHPHKSRRICTADYVINKGLVDL
jgi:hypothetical protein